MVSEKTVDECIETKISSPADGPNHSKVIATSLEASVSQSVQVKDDNLNQTIDGSIAKAKEQAEIANREDKKVDDESDSDSEDNDESMKPWINALNRSMERMALVKSKIAAMGKITFDTIAEGIRCGKLKVMSTVAQVQLKLFIY